MPRSRDDPRNQARLGRFSTDHFEAGAMTGANCNRDPVLVLGSRFAIKRCVGVFRSAAERPGVREQFRIDSLWIGSAI